MTENPFAVPKAVVADPAVDLGNVREIAHAQRVLLLSVLASIIGNMFLKTSGLAGALIILVYMAIAAFTIWSVYLLCQALSISSLTWIAAMFIPFVNLVCLVALNQKATSRLKSEGIKVGFLGVKI